MITVWLIMCFGFVAFLAPFLVLLLIVCTQSLDHSILFTAVHLKTHQKEMEFSKLNSRAFSVLKTLGSILQTKQNQYYRRVFIYGINKLSIFV